MSDPSSQRPERHLSFVLTLNGTVEAVVCTYKSNLGDNSSRDLPHYLLFCLVRALNAGGNFHLSNSQFIVSRDLDFIKISDFMIHAKVVVRCGRLLRTMLVPASVLILLVSTIMTAKAFTSTRQQTQLFPLHKVRLPRSNSFVPRHTNFHPTNLAATSSSSENNPIPVGGQAGEFFTPKLLDGAKFNLFGIGLKPDENPKDGAYQPPPNSMVGQVILITGASSGLGLESAKRLALAGATIVLTARTEDKAVLAVDAVCAYCRGDDGSSSLVFGSTGSNGCAQFVNMEPSVKGVALNFDDFSSVRSFSTRYQDCMIIDNDILKIDVLMNNAGGGGFPSRELTVDGYERTFQMCHLGHFLLTARLFEEGLLNMDTTVTKNKENGSNGGCTVINVSSVSHKCAEASHIKEGENNADDGDDIEYGYDFDNMNGEIQYSPEAYFQGKLANVLFTKELQRRANQSQQQPLLIEVSLEPGGVTTDIWRHNLGYDPRTFQERRGSNEKMMEQPLYGSWKAKLVS